MTVTNEDKATVRHMLKVLKELNEAIDLCSERNIAVEFSDAVVVMGKLNRTYICTKMERVTVERILP